MKHRIPVLILVVGAVVWATTPGLAQNKVDQQMLLELRTLQAQVQGLQLALNAANEQIKKNDGRVDTQANLINKGFADQKLQINEIASAQRSLKEGGNESAVRVLELQQEMKALRKGIDQQQTLLNEILALLQRPTTATGDVPVGDPATAAPPPTTPASSGGAAIPPSPGQYYTVAFGYFYSGQLESAVAALTSALQKFPEAPQAARAQFTIGESYAGMGGHDQEALAAYGLAIKNYKDPDAVPDAMLKQGFLYERLGQKENAGKVLQQLVKDYPNSSAVALATPALKRLGIIK